MNSWLGNCIKAAAALALTRAIALVISVPFGAPADGPGDWPMFRRDLARSGYNSNETALTPPLRLKLSYAT